MVDQVVAVNPHRTRLEPIADADGCVEALGMDGGRKTVRGAVADLDGILLRLELSDRADRTEDFLLHNLHVFADVGEDGWLDEVALVAVALTADFDLCAGLLAVVDVAKKGVNIRSCESRFR